MEQGSVFSIKKKEADKENPYFRQQ